MHLFSLPQSNQEDLVEFILSEFQENKVLARTILTGEDEESKKKFEDTIWYDLEMLNRQKEIDQKPYHDPDLYMRLLDKLEILNEQLEKLENEFQKIETPYKTLIKILCEYLSQQNIPSNNDEIVDKIKQSLDPHLLGCFDESNYNELAINVRNIYNEILRSQDCFRINKLFIENFLRKNFNSDEDSVTKDSYKIIIDINDEVISKINQIRKGKKQQLIHESGLTYPKITDELSFIKQSEKTKKIDLTSKQSAEETISDYIKMRSRKNLIHQYCNQFFIEHQRSNSQRLDAIESSYGYHNGYDISRHSKSLKKVIYPFVMDPNKKFSQEKKITGEEKTLVLPSSWSYIFSDIPIQLFQGRKGNIAFALLTSDKNIATIENSHEDLQFSDLSVFDSSGLKPKANSSQEIFDKKIQQRQEAISHTLPSYVDPWFDQVKQLSGHTESLVYGLPIGIIVSQGYEDVALEARRRYSEAGLMNANAPFFFYDPTQEKSLSLRHVCDQEIIDKANEIFLNQSISRLKYQTKIPVQTKMKLKTDSDLKESPKSVFDVTSSKQLRLENQIVKDI